MCGGNVVNAHPHAGWWKSSTPLKGRNNDNDGWGRQITAKSIKDEGERSCASMDGWGRQISDRSTGSGDRWGKQVKPKTSAKQEVKPDSFKKGAKGAEEEKSDSFKKEMKDGKKDDSFKKEMKGDKKKEEDSFKKEMNDDKKASPKKQTRKSAKALKDEDKHTRCPQGHPLVMMTIGKVPADCPSDMKYTGSRAHSCDICGLSPIRKGVVFRCVQCNYDVGPCCGKVQTMLTEEHAKFGSDPGLGGCCQRLAASHTNARNAPTGWRVKEP